MHIQPAGRQNENIFSIILIALCMILSGDVPLLISDFSSWSKFLVGHLSMPNSSYDKLGLNFDFVQVPSFGGLSGSEDRGGGDNTIQFINFGRVGDKSFKEWRQKIGGWKGG